MTTMEFKMTDLTGEVYTYTWMPYDVLQILRGGAWLDFSTLRTEGEARRALELVASGTWEGEQFEFHICRPNGNIVAE